MQTKLIPGKALRNNDAAILDGLNEVARDGGGKTMVIGIRNEAGGIYRAVQTAGLGEFFAIVGMLRDQIDLSDELAEASGMKEGCDAIFS